MSGVTIDPFFMTVFTIYKWELGKLCTMKKKYEKQRCTLGVTLLCQALWKYACEIYVTIFCP